MKQLASHLPRVALMALVVVLLASSLASIVGATPAASTSYRLTGYVTQPGGAGAPPVPAGVQVDLVSRGTATVYTATVTGNGGQFTFTTASTAGALGPGYWGLWVPAEANISLTHCGQCAVLPQSQNPTFAFYNGSELTDANYSVALPNVAVLPYNATLNGTVMSGGAPDQGAIVSLLAPEFNGLVLSNATSNATGIYGPMHVPEGTWVIQTVQASGGSTYTNSTNLTIASRTPPLFNPVLKSYFLSGRMNVTAGFVPTAGNATLYDPTNHYIYSTATAPGGYYGFATYPAGFTGSAKQAFNVILAAGGYQTAAYIANVTTASALTRNVLVSPITHAELGLFDTTLNFSALNVLNGSGNLSVTTNVTLGNDSSVPNLPNGSVGQLWAQLGLDFNNSLVFPSADNAALQSWIASTGPFFPATQAMTTVNGTGFVAPNATQAPASFASQCTTSCGLGSNANISYSWNHLYALNGTVPLNASYYTISFAFKHPTSPSDLFNYSVVLPKGYVLASPTTAPAQTSLVGVGPNGTWTHFTLVSKVSSTASADAKFKVVKLGTPTPIVNVSVNNFAFSKANVLNSSEGNYSVVVGKGQNVTFSAINSTYPVGTNATSFTWNFGDGNSTTTNNTSANHTYTKSTGTGNCTGSLTIHASGGTVNSTAFHVYVVNATAPVANISSNASANYSVGGHPYLIVNWSDTLSFNASLSTIAPPNVLSIAYYKLVGAKGFNTSQNFSVSKGANWSSNWSFQFNGVTGAGSYITAGNVGGHSVPFKGGWQYNLTLTVWTATGKSANTTLVILVNDTQIPTAAFRLQTLSGKVVPSTGLTEASNGTAAVVLNASASNNPNGSQIVKFVWKINNTASNWTNKTLGPFTTAKKPFPVLWLPPQTTVYSINLNVTDENGNYSNSTQTLSVSPNATTRPILEATNLTGPTSLTQGTTSTFYVNVTIGGGSKAVAKNVTVSWYILGSSGTGSKTFFSGSPARCCSTTTPRRACPTRPPW